MVRKLTASAIVLAAFAATTAHAAIAMDDAGFTAYIQQRLQLYSPTPIKVTSPYNLSVGANPLPSVKPLHDSCAATPDKCDALVDNYVQGVAHDVLQKMPAAPAATAPATTPAGVTTLYACNHTSRVLETASIYMPVSSTQWRTVGWLNVDPGTCRPILSTANKDFYARAEEANRQQMHDPNTRGGMSAGDGHIANAGGDTQLCVPHEGNWDQMSDSFDKLCDHKEKEDASFRTFHAEGHPIQVWNLTL